ncbi:unnamed protein product, partial [Closterium sp. NIES-53]
TRSVGGGGSGRKGREQGGGQSVVRCRPAGAAGISVPVHVSTTSRAAITASPLPGHASHVGGCGRGALALRLLGLQVRHAAHAGEQRCMRGKRRVWGGGASLPQAPHSLTPLSKSASPHPVPPPISLSSPHQQAMMKQMLSAMQSGGGGPGGAANPFAAAGMGGGANPFAAMGGGDNPFAAMGGGGAANPFGGMPFPPPASPSSSPASSPSSASSGSSKAKPSSTAAKASAAQHLSARACICSTYFPPFALLLTLVLPCRYLPEEMRDPATFKCKHLQPHLLSFIPPLPSVSPSPALTPPLLLSLSRPIPRLRLSLSLPTPPLLLSLLLPTPPLRLSLSLLTPPLPLSLPLNTPPLLLSLPLPTPPLLLSLPLPTPPLLLFLPLPTPPLRVLPQHVKQFVKPHVPPAAREHAVSFLSLLRLLTLPSFPPQTASVSLFPIYPHFSQHYLSSSLHHMLPPVLPVPLSHVPSFSVPVFPLSIPPFRTFLHYLFTTNL